MSWAHVRADDGGSVGRDHVLNLSTVSRIVFERGEDEIQPDGRVIEHPAHFISAEVMTADGIILEIRDPTSLVSLWGGLAMEGIQVPQAIKTIIDATEARRYD